MRLPLGTESSLPWTRIGLLSHVYALDRDLYRRQLTQLFIMAKLGVELQQQENGSSWALLWHRFAHVPQAQ